MSFLSFLPVPLTLPQSKGRTPPRRRPSQTRTSLPLCNIPPPSFDDETLKKLHARVSALRSKEVQRNRKLAHNWRMGHYTAHVVASVSHDYVRKLSLNGDMLALGTATGSVVLSDLRTGLRLTCRHAHEGQVTAVDYREGVIATAGSDDHVVMVWRCAEFEQKAFWDARMMTGKPIDGELPKADLCLKEHGNVVTAVRIDVGRKRLYSASVDGTIRVFNLESGERLVVIRVGEPILSMTLTEKGYLLVGCASGRVLAYQAERGLYLLSMVCHKANTTALDFWEESQTLVTGDSLGNLSVWSFEDSSFIGALPKHDAAVISVQLDSSKVVSASRDGSVAVSGLKSRETQFRIVGFTKYIGAVTFDDARLISDGTNDIVVCHRFDIDGNAS